MIDASKIERIREIIKNNYNWLLFKVAGGEKLSAAELSQLQSTGLLTAEEIALIEDAYFIGYLRNDPMTLPVDRPKIPLPEFINRYQPRLVQLTDKEKFALDHAKTEIGNYITSLGAKAETAIESIINKQNIAERNRILDEEIRPTIDAGIENRRTNRQIAADLRDATGDMYRDWKRVASTEMSTAMSLGEVDAIKKRHADKKTNEIYVYVSVNRDEALCKYCKKLYLNGNKPRIFLLSDILANGNNYGVKAENYKATIPPLHPRCRCSLQTLPKGFGFNKQGKIEFISKDHDEYKTQNTE